MMDTQVQGQSTGAIQVTLPSGWIWQRIGEIGRVSTGNTPPKADLDNYGDYLPLVKPPELRDAPITEAMDGLSEKGARLARVVPPNAVLVSCIGNLGKTGIAQTTIAFNQQINAIVADEHLNPRYVFYYFQSIEAREWLARLASATTVTIVNKSKFESIPIPVAPLPEQHRIVAEIETQFTRLDAGVAALKRVQANLRRYKASVLKAACEGLLVPSEAELARVEGREFEPASVLLERILTERRVKWEQANPGKRYVEPKGPEVDGLPDIREGWVWASMEQLADVVGGVTKGRNLAGQDTLILPYLRVANVQQGWLDLAEIKGIEALPSDLEKYRLHDGDLLLTEGGDRDKLGRSAIWKDAVKDCIHQNHIFRARTFHGDLLSEWLMYNTNSEQGRQYFMKQGKQTTNLASINLTQLRGFPVPLPPAAEQHRIVAEVELRLSVVQEVEATVTANLKRAERLRQSILKRAFEGRLVAQNSEDEPASALLERIKANK